MGKPILTRKIIKAAAKEGLSGSCEVAHCSYVPFTSLEYGGPPQFNVRIKSRKSNRMLGVRGSDVGIITPVYITERVKEICEKLETP